MLCPYGASPGLTAGRGLKQQAAGDDVEPGEGIARPHGRARIETNSFLVDAYESDASPGLTAGRGLKLFPAFGRGELGKASPGLTAGRGLKLAMKIFWSMYLRHRPASRPGAD